MNKKAGRQSKNLVGKWVPARAGEYGCYAVAITNVAGRFLRLQADGGYESTKAFLDRYGRPDDDLTRDINRIDAAHLPFGLVVEQEHG